MFELTVPVYLLQKSVKIPAHIVMFCLCFFLQDNELVDICSALSHLTNLQVLMLQSNQLTKLEPTIKEFRAMQALHTLSE